MKKTKILLLIFALLLSLLISCEQAPTNQGGDSTTATAAPVETTGSTTASTTAPAETTGATTAATTAGSTTSTTSPDETTAGSTTETTVTTVETNNGGNVPPTPPTEIYTDFTPEEKDIFLNVVGEVIPFIPNGEYYVETTTNEYGTQINFYTFGNTEAEFEAYLDLLDGYTLVGTEVDEYGDTWYYYEKDTLCIDVSYYVYEGESVIDLYAYLDDGEGGEGGGEGGSTEYLYTDFSTEEKDLFLDTFGHIIPFIPNNEYYVESDSDEYGPYLNFYTFGNTEAEFEAYLDLFDGYTFDGTGVDDFGDTWYYYSSGDLCIDVSYYAYEGDYVVDVYVYVEDNSGGSDGGDSVIPDGTEPITNDGKGLPTDADGDGVHNVDFTKAEQIKNVTDLFPYMAGCPTVGSPAVLVIPVEFIDVTAESKNMDISKLSKAFASNDLNDNFWSVYEYYMISSYGKLTLDVTVLDQWFRPAHDSTYYANSIDADGYANGDQLIIDEALAYLSTFMDLSVFDSDNNDIIDSIVIINTLDIDGTKDFNWAYQYWNYHVDEDGYYYEYDGVCANDYVWASFNFLHESYDEDGNVDYSDRTVMNNYTYIHEFGHILGADDYYDTSYSSDETPMNGLDIMDDMMGDHNAYTKFHYGWLTSSRLVVCEDTVTLTLEAFSKNGDTIILANNWDDALGVYQEYYVIVYHTREGLNAGEDSGYFTRDGVVVYHINSSLYSEVYDDETYYFVYNNNTHPSDQNGSENNLIEYVKSAGDTYTYVEGDTMSATYDDAGNALIYNFVVDSISDGTATITFTKN